MNLCVCSCPTIKRTFRIFNRSDVIIAVAEWKSRLRDRKNRGSRPVPREFCTPFHKTMISQIMVTTVSQKRRFCRQRIVVAEWKSRLRDRKNRGSRPVPREFCTPTHKTVISQIMVTAVSQKRRFCRQWVVAAEWKSRLRDRTNRGSRPDPWEFRHVRWNANLMRTF
ncbi:hypothetical protein AVEN_158847-1 [Araneus ventricosus]|uniref:Uncharacterized protein n=1 Tax=Araneus ventricosus TaxID=182803 RepID=A0A4Y2MY97_ARAVE|nr:hypothetical protein AVEN_158847-1 [Araneus ventricosus]